MSLMLPTQATKLGKRSRSRSKRRIATTMTAIAVLCNAISLSAAGAEEVIFDEAALRAQGIDPELAKQFRLGATFLAGKNMVMLSVNGAKRGKYSALFNHEGQLCPDAGLLRRAGLKVPPGVPKEGKAADVCFDLREVWPQFTLEPDPSTGTLNIIVPQEALDPEADTVEWQHGGAAGLLNYNAQYMASRSTGSDTRYWQIQSEAGFNVGDWAVRSNQNVYHFGEETRADYQNVMAQRTFQKLKSTLQVGQIPLTGGMFGVGQVIGFQMTPEQALYKSSGAAIVSGVADTPSVVTIRQLGIPVWHTTVPAGPFSLSGFSLLNTRTDLEVTVSGSNGEQQVFIVPASAYLREGATVSPGVTWGVGRYDQTGIDSHPTVGVVSGGIQAAKRVAIQAGGLWSDNYQAGAVGVNTNFPWKMNMVFQYTQSVASSPSQQGGLSSLSLTQPFGDNLSVNLNGSHQDNGYREFSETLVRSNDDSRNRDQYGASVSWTHEVLGGFNLSWSRSTQTRGDAVSWVQLGWGRQIGRVNLNVNASRSSGNYDGKHEDRLYITAQLPLGDRGSISSYMNRNAGKDRYGVRLDQSLSRDRNWSLAVDRDNQRKTNAMTGTFSAVTPWTNLNGSASGDSDNYRSLSAQASGGMVIHAHGITMTPYRVRDTFGIARVGNKGGVRLDTPSGPVWTDRNGYAVLPELGAWQTSTIEVDTRSLGYRSDVVNGVQEIGMARGAVGRVDFGLVSTRRVLITLKGSSGQALPAGTAVYGDDDTFLTVVSEDGSVFLPDAHPGMRLNVDVKSAPCSVTLDTLPEAVPEETLLYEEMNAVCR